MGYFKISPPWDSNEGYISEADNMGYSHEYQGWQIPAVLNLLAD